MIASSFWLIANPEMWIVQVGSILVGGITIFAQLNEGADAEKYNEG